MAEKSDVKVGDEFKPLRKEIGKYTPIYYAGASGDFNPIHIDPEFGKMVGLGGNILQGLCTMAYAAQANTDWLGDPGRLKKLKVRFATPVKPDDTVTVHGKVTEREGTKIKCDIWAENQNGEKILTSAFSETEIE